MVCFRAHLGFSVAPYGLIYVEKVRDNKYENKVVAKRKTVDDFSGWIAFRAGLGCLSPLQMISRSRMRLYGFKRNE